MYLIPKQFIASFGRMGQVEIPMAVDSLCPYCNRLISFTSINWSSASTPHLATGISRCPACKSISTLIYIETPTKRKRKNHELFIYPAPKKNKLPLEGSKETNNLPKSLQRAYFSALNVYNNNEWSATAVLCRRLLEGITKSLLPKELQNKSLFQQLKILPKHQNLSEPIIKLAEAIRQGGNLGAHFDLDKEPNEKTASLMIELIEYLLEYLFILPNKIEHLYETITKNQKTL